MTTDELEVGDLFMIVEDCVTGYIGKMGIVIKTYPDRDSIRFVEFGNSMEDWNATSTSIYLAKVELLPKAMKILYGIKDDNGVKNEKDV